MRTPIGAVRQAADPRSVLHDVFGFTSFRGQQEEIVRCVVGGGDALVVMPTGSGKSLCYQIPALLRAGTGIVVSPLIALMEDQVTALRQLGIRAEFLNSSLPPEEQSRVRRQTAAGEVDLLYVAPERLLSDSFLAWLERLPVALFAIDEAHCVSQWGHDFRPEYLQLAVLHERWPEVPRIALTATADPPTRREIAARLGLAEARMFVGGFDRPNIRYRVTPKSSARTQLVQFLRAEHEGDAGIVYCLSRKRTEETAAYLASARAGAPCRTTPASPPTSGARPSRSSCATRCASSSPRSRSGWASTSRTCVSCTISIRPRASRRTTRRPAAPAATACRQPP